MLTILQLNINEINYDIVNVTQRYVHITGAFARIYVHAWKRTR